MRLALVGLLVPALLVTGCGSQVKQSAATPTPTPTPTQTSGIPWPVVTDPATPATAVPSPSPSASGAARSTGTPSPTPSASPTAEALGRDPLLLVGWWRVATAAGEVDLGLGEDAVVVHPCGTSSIDWAASPTGLFVGSGYGGSGSCYEHPPRPDLRWLEGSWTFAVSKQRLLLVDESGAVVARGVREKPPGDNKPFPVTPRLKARLADARQLPQGVRPVTSALLARTWVPHGADAGNGRAYATFARNRTWTGSDGCNGAGGRYSLGDFGETLTTSGPSTAIGCHNSPAPLWVQQARRLGIDPKDGALVLYDATATLLGRLYTS